MSVKNSLRESDSCARAHMSDHDLQTAKSKENYEIAVIGVDLKFPACENIEEYWQILNNEINCISKFKAARREKVEEYSSNFFAPSEKKEFLPGAYIETIDEFDHEYFKIPPREASLMDPVHRLFLQTVIKTFEDAGYSANMLKKTRTGIFVGYTSCSFKDNYLMDIFLSEPELLPYSLVGNMAAIIPSRISHLLDLRGPAMVMDTACSSSLVAIHEACQSIINGSCDMAIASGVKLHLLPVTSEYFKLGIESSDGKTRAFDTRADGSGIGEGVAAVLLKPLKQAEKDLDHIYAVIKGSAVNHDGTAVGLTAPNPGAQTQVILDAWENSGMALEQVEYIETHGTATALGDPVEIQGLTKAFQKFTDKKQFCALSSVKTNLGHLFECAGIASFIKVLLAIQNARIPATLNFAIPNEKIDFLNTPFYINAKKKPWHPENPDLRVAGVSAFGLSGTNCHVVLSGYKGAAKKTNLPEASGALLTISAKSRYSLQKLVELYAKYVEDNFDELDVQQFCYQANCYRIMMSHRIALVVNSKQELLEQLKLEQLKFSTDKQSSPSLLNGGHQLSHTPEPPADKKLQRSASSKINNILTNSKSLTYDDLKTIGACFVDGGMINWDLFYPNIAYEKLRLPTYPFVPSHHWLPLKAVPKRKKYYQKTWVPREISNKRDSAGQILVIDPYHALPEDFYRLLSNHCEQVIKAAAGEDIGEEARDNIDLYLATPQDYQDCFTKYDRIDTIVLSCSPGFTEEKDAVPEFEENLRQGLYILLDLYQNLSPSRMVKLCVLSDCGFQVDGSEPYLKPENTILYGFGKCMKRENKNIGFSFIDIDKQTSHQRVISEILCNDPHEIAVYRNGARLVEGIAEIDPGIYKDPPRYKIQDQGVYLITGGLGGIGFETAKLLCGKAKDISLVIVNRAVLPERGQWQPASAGQDGSILQPDLAVKIKRLEELEKIAGRVDYYACDVANMQETQKVVDCTVKKYGKINGIIHCAGVGGEYEIGSLTREKLHNLIASKIYGAKALDLFTRQYELDFFLMFSSIATTFSGMGLAAYTAANTYLDAFSAYYNRSRKGQATTINWSTWSQTGMSVQHDFTIDTLFKALGTSEGIQLLDNILGVSLSNIIAGELNLESKIALLLKKYPIQLSESLADKLAKLAMTPKGAGVAPGMAAVSSSAGQGTRIVGGGKYKEIEIQIGKICGEILGYEEIGVNESFFELGADSIMLRHIYSKLNLIFPGKLQITEMFAYPSIAQMAQFLASKEGVILQNEASASREEERNRRALQKSGDGRQDVAVIGVGFYFPCADSLDDYWDVLINGINTVRSIPSARSADMLQHYRNIGMEEEQIKFRKFSYLDRINQFDYELFKISPREAQLLDPVARLFLQCCWRAIEDAGYGGDLLAGSKTGVFLGYSANMANSYSMLLYETDRQLFGESLAVNQVSMAASRIAYVKDLKGPSLVVDTACSSSLVAIHTACEQIKSGMCNMALAGGASLSMMPIDYGMGVGYESPENKTRPFAKGAEGSASGEGIGVVLLKSLDAALADKDDIYAVIKGSAMNQDGSSFGIAAPNYLAQSEVIRQAWANSEIDPQTISYIEAHGTGTQLGDPIEIRGIQHAFSQFTAKKQFCAVGSVKSNLGHLNEAAGMTGFIKLMLMLKYRQIPPTINFIQPNENIDFCNSPLYTATKKRDWKTEDAPLRAGISGFGMSGTNCHIVVEEPPRIPCEGPSGAKIFPFLFSAKNLHSLILMVQNLLRYLDVSRDAVTIDQVSAIMTAGRSHFKYRMAIFAVDLDDLIAKLRTVTLNFPGNIGEDWFFYGSHHIVPESKKHRDDGDITTSEQLDLTRKAQELLSQIAENRQAGMEVWAGLLTLYARGAEAPWRNLYSGKLPKVHLPAYPFEKNHVWLPYKQNSDNTLDGLFHVKRWEKEALDLKTVQSVKKLETVLIFYHPAEDFTAIVSELKKQNIQVIEVFLAEGYRGTGAQFFMDSSPDSMIKLFQDIKSFSIDAILFTHAVFKGAVPDLEHLGERMESGFFHAISMIQGFAKAHYKKNVELIFLCRNIFTISGDESELQPESATVAGLGKVIEQEFPNILCRTIDIGDTWAPGQIIEELMAPDTKPYFVALRNGQRYVEALDEITPQPAREILKKDGTYLVTGGTSGIGLETAKYLSENGCRNIIILSRTKFPDEESWETMAAENADFSAKLDAVKQIRQNGSRLYFYTGDVSDRNRMVEIMGDIRKTVGNLNGVFHSAGIAGAGFILRKEREVFLNILNPKVNGTWILDEVTKGEPLDFMMLYSSSVTYTGEAGQSDYVAANSYLEAYADYRNKKGRRTFVINWVSWKETGMAVRHGINFDDITKALPTKQAIDGLDFILKSDQTRVMIGQYNVTSNSLNIILNGRYRIAQAFLDKLRTKQNKIARGRVENFAAGPSLDNNVDNGKLILMPHSSKAGASNSNLPVKLLGKDEGMYSPVEEKLAGIYSMILGFQEIDVYDNFFEMGGDSIMLTKMHRQIDKQYPGIITSADLFEFTSISSLAGYIKEQLPESVAESNTITHALKSVPGTVFTDPKTGVSLTTYPLSHAQKGIYIESKLNRHKTLYNNPLAAELEEPVAPDKLEDCLKKIVSRHEALRTGFMLCDKTVRQVIFDDVNVNLKFVRLPDGAEIDFASLLTAFNLLEPPLFQVTIIELASGKQVLFFDIHHIIADGFSSSIIVRDLLTLLNGQAVPELPYQYRHYIQFQMDQMARPSFAKMEDYWRRRLEHFHARVNVPYDFEPAKKASADGDTICYEMEDGLETKLYTCAKQGETTLFSLLLANFYLALYFSSGEEDMAVGVPVLGRDHPDLMEIVGMFVNTLPMRTAIHGEMRLGAFVANVSRQVLSDMKNQSYPLDKMVEMRRKHGEDTNLFFIMFEYENESMTLHESQSKARSYILPLKSSKFDICITVSKKNGKLLIKLDYRTDLYAQGTMSLFLDQYYRMLKEFNWDKWKNLKISEIKEIMQ